MSFKIKNIHAFVAVGDDGDEGVIGEMINGVMTPFVCADEARVESLREKAFEIGKHTGKKVKLVRFSTREDVEEIV